MKPISSFESICEGSGLNLSQTDTLKCLVDNRRGYLHPHWIQLAFYMPLVIAKRLHYELVANEWAVDDELEVLGVTYETALTNDEIQRIAIVEFYAGLANKTWRCNSGRTITIWTL